MRRHFYLVIEANDESKEGGVDILEQRYERAKKNEQRVIEKRNLETNERFNETVVSLGYYDFENEEDYRERNFLVSLEKLNEIDERHLEDAGLDVEMVKRKLRKAQDDEMD